MGVEKPEKQKTEDEDWGLVYTCTVHWLCRTHCLCFVYTCTVHWLCRTQLGTAQPQLVRLYFIIAKTLFSYLCVYFCFPKCYLSYLYFAFYLNDSGAITWCHDDIWCQHFLHSVTSPGATGDTRWQQCMLAKSTSPYATLVLVQC